MKKLLVFLKDYKKETVLAPLFKLLEASFELLVPLVMAAIIDKGVGNADRGYIGRMCFVMIMLGVVGLVCSITAQYFAAKAAVGFAAKMKHALFAHIQSLSFTEMDTVGTSTLITRMTSDSNQVQNGVNMVLRLFLRSPFIVFGAMVMAFTIDVKAALVFVVTIPLLSVVVFGIMMLTMPLYKKVQGGLDRVLGITRENLTGVRVLRAFNKEENEIDRFETSNNTLTSMQKHVGKISALMNPVTYVIINGAIIVLVWTGAWRVENGIITQGAVVALVNYMSQILVELIKLANLIITITKAIACGNRIQSIFEIESSMKDGNGCQDDGHRDSVSGQDTGAVGKKALDRLPSVEFDHVCLTYKNAGAESLTDVSFKAYRGETIGIIGGTGSGKSSLVNLIPRFYDATEGEVLIDGINVKEYTQKALRNKIGYVPQKSVMFSGTIASNVAYGDNGRAETDADDIIKAVEIAQATEFVNKKEEKYDAPVAQGGSNLSGGQKQRLSIARAICRQPEIYIFDDSFSALDYKTDRILRSELKKETAGVTTLIVAQRIGTIKDADQILVIDKGRVVGQGKHHELLKTCDVYREIAESQLSKEELEYA